MREKNPEAASTPRPTQIPRRMLPKEAYEENGEEKRPEDFTPIEKWVLSFLMQTGRDNWGEIRQANIDHERLIDLGPSWLVKQIKTVKHSRQILQDLNKKGVLDLEMYVGGQEGYQINYEGKLLYRKFIEEDLNQLINQPKEKINKLKESDLNQIENKEEREQAKDLLKKVKTGAEYAQLFEWLLKQGYRAYPAVSFLLNLLKTM